MDDNIREIVRLLKDAYDKAMQEDDYYGKSAEGKVLVVFNYGNVFDEDYGKLKEVHVTIYSYVFGPGRLHTFSGSSLSKASGKALKNVREWLKKEEE